MQNKISLSDRKLLSHIWYRFTNKMQMWPINGFVYKLVIDPEVYLKVKYLMKSMEYSEAVYDQHQLAIKCVIEKYARDSLFSSETRSSFYFNVPSSQ